VKFAVIPFKLITPLKPPGSKFSQTKASQIGVRGLSLETRGQ
jgi:hypothetical protein